MKVKGRAHAEEQRRLEPLPVLRHELLLFRRAQPHPKDVRPQLAYEVLQLLLFGRVQRPERGRVGAGDLQARKPLLQPRLERVGHARRTAVKKMRVAPRPRELANPQHQVRPINPPHLPEPLPAAHPDRRHAVGRRQKRAVQNRPEGGVGLGFAYAMHPRHAHIPLGFPRQGLGDRRHGRIQVDRTDAHPQNIGAAGFDLIFRALQRQAK